MTKSLKSTGKTPKIPSNKVSYQRKLNRELDLDSIDPFSDFKEWAGGHDEKAFRDL